MDIEIRTYGFLEEDGKKMKEEGERLAKGGWYNCHYIAMKMADQYGCYTTITWKGKKAFINCYSPTYS